MEHYKLIFLSYIKRYKTPIFLNDINIDIILVTNKISISKKNYKHFIGYLDKNKIELLTIISAKSNGYVKSYGCETKWMQFLIEDEKLFKKYN